MTSSKNHNDGFTLIEILIVVAIMSIVTTVMASVLSRQVSDQKRVMQRAEINDLKTVLSMILSDRDRCITEFSGVSFDSSNPTAASPSQSNDIGQILYDPAVATSVAVQANRPLPGTQSGLAATRIYLANIQTAYVAPAKPRYSAVLRVEIDPATTVGSFHPVEVPLTIYTDTPGGNTPVTSCAGTVATPQAACQSIMGAYWDAVNNECVLPNKQCETAAVPSADGLCDQNNANPAVCPYGGHGGVYACTAVGWQCVNSECKTTPTTTTNVTNVTNTTPANNQPVCANQTVPAGSCTQTCWDGTEVTGQTVCTPNGWGCIPATCSGQPPGGMSDDGDDDGN